MTSSSDGWTLSALRLSRVYRGSVSKVSADFYPELGEKVGRDF